MIEKLNECTLEFSHLEILFNCHISLTFSRNSNLSVSAKSLPWKVKKKHRAHGHSMSDII